MKENPLQPVGVELQPQARTHDLVVRELPEEELIYDLRNHKAYCLNRTAAAVWKQCDGRKTIEDITALLAQETKTQVSSVEVRLALYLLGKANLLEQSAVFSMEKPRQSRREILRRLGTAAALPMVISIIAPLAVQAQTCGPANNSNNLNAVGCACQGADDCASNCCGFSATPGNICVTPGSVPSGSPCRASCECPPGKSCPTSSPRICT